MNLPRAVLAALSIFSVNAHLAKADIVETAFESRTLGRPLGVSIYLPPRYELTDARYPVLYLLHGLGDDHRTWPRAGMETILDEAIADGAAPLIVVMQNAGRSWYADTKVPDGPGNLHAVIRDDLVAYVDATWRSRSQRDARAIAGHSMGAQGALSIAFGALDRFGAAASLSLSPGPELVARIQDGGTLPDNRAAGWLGGAYGVPFQPNLYLADLPETRAETLEPMTAPRLYLHASDDDPYDTHVRTFALYLQLRDRGNQTELRITDGGHSWAVWKRELSSVIPFLDAGTNW